MGKQLGCELADVCRLNDEGVGGSWRICEASVVLTDDRLQAAWLLVGRANPDIGINLEFAQLLLEGLKVWHVRIRACSDDSQRLSTCLASASLGALVDQTILHIQDGQDFTSWIFRDPEFLTCNLLSNIGVCLGHLHKY